MILVKNRLKKLKKDNDDEMLKQLKYSPPMDDDFDFILDNTEYEDKATQIPDTANNFSQTTKKDMADKETDTYEELNKIIGDYILKMSSNNFKSKEPSRAEKMTMAFTQMIAHKDKPQSSSSSGSDSEGALSRNVRRGFRIAEMAGNVVATTFNVASDLADFLVEATAPRAQGDETADEEESDEEEEEPSGSTDIPFRRERSRSRDDDNNLGERLLQRGASRSRSSTPDKNPKKKYK